MRRCGLTPVVGPLSELLGKPVLQNRQLASALDAEAKVAALAEWRCVLLENVRFFAEEEKNDPGFAAKLAAPGRCLCEDAFAPSTGPHASNRRP